MNRKITVLHIIEHMKVGGRERMLLKTLSKNDNEKIKPIVVCFKSGELIQSLKNLNIEVIIVKPKIKLLRIVELIRVIKKTKADVVHTHLFSAGFWGRIAAKICGVENMIHTHGTTTFTEKKSKRILPEIILTWFTHHVICVSQNVKDHLKDAGLSSKNMLVIPNAIEIERFEYSEFKAFNKPLKLLGIGRLEKVKGWDILLKAMKILKDKSIETELQIAGAGSMKEELEHIANNLSVKLELLGLRDDIPELIKNADIMTAPSLREGLSSALLEAMVSGLPLVATKVGGNIELLDDLTPLVDPLNPENLVDHILKLIQTDDSIIKERLQKSKQRVIDHYSIDSIAKQHLKLYLSGYTKAR